MNISDILLLQLVFLLPRLYFLVLSGQGQEDANVLWSN